MFKVILIATDLSDTSEHALNVAAQLPREHGSKLHLVHVIRDPATEPWALEAFGATFDALLEEARARAKPALVARARAKWRHTAAGSTGSCSSRSACSQSSTS